MSKEIPKVTVLKAITPQDPKADVLTYGNLQTAVNKYSPDEYARLNTVWNTETGSIEEHQAAEQLAMHYMLVGALALNETATDASKKLWSERYTKASSEIYGLPEAEVAQKLFVMQQNGEKLGELFGSAQEPLRNYLHSKYEPVYAALGLENAPDQLDPTEIANRFESAIAVLADQYDESWREWSVERNEEKDSLSVVAGNKQVVVGMKRAHVTPTQLKSLFSHEVLVHAQRSVNGAKLSKELSTGLPGYLDAEEGLGVFVEYAISGELKDVVIDRYVDIAYALGMVDGKQHTRQELLELAMLRANKRNEQAEIKKSEEDIQKETYAHVNRIYRGSLGDEHIGIFTKDIAYYRGFLEAGRYIEARLAEGQTIDDIMSVLFSGKFDPENPAHIDYINSLK